MIGLDGWQSWRGGSDGADISATGSPCSTTGASRSPMRAGRAPIPRAPSCSASACGSGRRRSGTSRASSGRRAAPYPPATASGGELPRPRRRGEPARGRRRRRRGPRDHPARLPAVVNPAPTRRPRCRITLRYSDLPRSRRPQVRVDRISRRRSRTPRRRRCRSPRIEARPPLGARASRPRAAHSSSEVRYFARRSGSTVTPSPGPSGTWTRPSRTGKGSARMSSRA